MSNTHNQLEPFQGWPQLLDQYLTDIAKPLTDCCIVYINHFAGEYHDVAKTSAPESVPLPRAICKILYVLCKIRGHKIISKFFSSEPQHLEEILNAYDAWSSNAVTSEDSTTEMTWEERYILLLWLAHLSLVPFDLKSMSSNRTLASAESVLPDAFVWSRLPSVTQRLLFISFQSLGSFSKEQDATIILISRLTMRKDMFQLGLYRVVMMLCLDQEMLSSAVNRGLDQQTFGKLSLLTYLIKHSPSQYFKGWQSEVAQWIIERHWLAAISERTHRLVIVMSRSLALQCKVDLEAYAENLGVGIETIFDGASTMNIALRFTASKALAIIGREVPAVAFDILDVVTETSLDDIDEAGIVEAPQQDEMKDILLPLQKKGETLLGLENSVPFGHTNSSSLHLQILTLAYFAYQRSLPENLLPQAIIKFIKALHYMERNALGVEKGSAVRDAGCFGLWALARSSTTVQISGCLPLMESNLQAIASHLVVTALLDPVGNVRRAASAALQEAIGRHPNTIACGKSLELIQIVDYHAVSSRKRAMSEATISAAKVDISYERPLLAGLMSWRCLQVEDVAARKGLTAQCHRDAADTIGKVSLLSGNSGAFATLRDIRIAIATCQPQDRPKKHGWYHALAANITNLQQSRFKANWTAEGEDEIRACTGILVQDIGQEPQIKTFKVDYNVQEGQASLLTALATFEEYKIKEKSAIFLEEKYVEVLLDWLSATQKFQYLWSRPDIGAEASKALFKLLISEKKQQVLDRWIKSLTSLTGQQRIGSLASLAAVYHDARFQARNSDAIEKVFLQELDLNTPIEVRVHAIVWLHNEILPSSPRYFDGHTEPLCNPALIEAIIQNLNDYTVDRRGDIGSLARLEAIDAAAVLVLKSLLGDVEAIRLEISASLLGLAIEKLDKVRFRAGACLATNWDSFFPIEYEPP